MFLNLKTKIFNKNNLRLFFPKEQKIIFVHTDEIFDIREKKINLILSPAFYWCKKEKLGLKSIYNAKKIAHSFFEANIPQGEYRYLVRKTKEEGEFLFFAYDEALIIKKLSNLGIPSNKINNIYFAQTEFENIEAPLKISSDSALVVINSIVSVLPVAFTNDAQELDIKNIKLSKKKVTVRNYNSLGVKPLKIYSLSAVAALLLVALFFENRYYKNYLTLEATKQEEMLKKASLPTTAVQLESIRKGLQKREEESNGLRENITKLTEIVTSDKEITINEIKITAEQIVVSYNSKKIASLQQIIKKMYPKAKQTQNNDILKVEITR